MTNGSAVSANLTLTLVDSQREAIASLTASFHYTERDPYAVRVAFHVGLDEPVEWFFARDLLSAGIDGPQGLGDVRVWPSAPAKPGIPGTDLNVELLSPYGRADFTVPISKLGDFLRRTYAVVPAGQESFYVDIDAGVAELLREMS